MDEVLYEIRTSTHYSGSVPYRSIKACLTLHSHIPTKKGQSPTSNCPYIYLTLISLPENDYSSSSPSSSATAAAADTTDDTATITATIQINMINPKNKNKNKPSDIIPSPIECISVRYSHYNIRNLQVQHRFKNIFFTSNRQLEPGMYVTVKITDAEAYDLMGEEVL